MNPFDLRFSDKGKNALSAQENELNKISYTESPSFNEKDQTNYELRDQIRATYSKQPVIPLVTKFNPDKDFVSKTFAKNELAIVPQDISSPVFENTNASKEDLRFASFAKDVYSDTANRSDLDGYKYTPEFSSDKYGTYISDDDIVFSVKGTTTETIPETIGNLAKNTAIALGVPTVPGSDKSYIQQLLAGASTGIVPGAIGTGLVTAGVIASTPALVATGALAGLSLLGTGLLYNDLDTFQSEIDKIKETYPNKKINITGHSQGGTYANLLGINNKDSDVITYNAGKGLNNFYNDIKCKYEDCSNIKNYRIVGDFASMLPSEFQVGQSFQLKPKIPDAQTQLEAKSAESFFIPSDLYIPHNIRNFEDRNLKNLMPDYGLFGRTLARRTGAGLGLATLSATTSALASASTGISETIVAEESLALEKTARATENFTEDILNNLGNIENNNNQLVRDLFDTTAIRQRQLQTGNLLDVGEYQAGLESYYPSANSLQGIGRGSGTGRELGNQLTNILTSNKAVKDTVQTLSKGQKIINNMNDVFTKTGAVTGVVASGGSGDIFGALTYDPYFKPLESELESF